MKTDLVRNLVVTTSLLAGLTGTSSALATTVSETLGHAASATDRYTVNCQSSPTPALNTHRITGNVMDLSPVQKPVVSMVFTEGSGSTQTTDPIDADPASSPVASLIQGPGAYTVLVNKSMVGAENYSMDVFCRNSTGQPLNTPVVITQDQ